MGDLVATTLAAALSGACPTLSVIADNHGQHYFYNCYAELKLHVSQEDCIEGRCIGSIYIVDRITGNSLVQNVAGDQCAMSTIRNASTFWDRRFQAGTFLNHESVKLAVGSDGRLLSVAVGGSFVKGVEAKDERVVCRGHNPVRRTRDRDR